MSTETTQPEMTPEEKRLAKNEKIKASNAATRERRKQQVCRVYDIKIQINKLSKAQKEALRGAFLEAKWLRNDCLAHGIDAYQAGKTAEVKTPDGIETRELKPLGSQLKQSVIQQLINDRNALAKAKANGRKVGALRFKSHVDSIDLKQYGVTYEFKPNGRRMRIQKIPGTLRIRGHKQIPAGAEYANAKLVRKADGYHVMVTCYFDRKTKGASGTGRNRESADGTPTVIGVDLGLGSTIVTSDGRKAKVVVEETDRLKRLQAKLARQVKGSNGYRRTQRLIRREYQRVGNRKDDAANKIVHALKQNDIIFFQDENIKGWRKRDGFVRGGRTVQHSCLGRIKAKLVACDDAVMLPRSFATTQYCPVCGNKTKHGPDKRTYVCAHCGHTADRDVHAACNMIRLGVPFAFQTPAVRREAHVEGLTTSTDEELALLSAKPDPMKHEAPWL